MKPDYLYKNRKEAGEQLAHSLDQYKDQDVIVIGIPRGGVEIGYYVSKYLNAELSIIISKKIPHPLQPEYGIGALSEGDIVYIPHAMSLDTDVINQIILKLKIELERRILIYHKEKPLPELKNRTVILVDDGIATGVTMIAAIRLCRKMETEKIIVAVPVAGKRLNKDLYEADELYILQQPVDFEGVGGYYEDFTQLSDKDVLFFLNKSKSQFD